MAPLFQNNSSTSCNPTGGLPEKDLSEEFHALHVHLASYGNLGSPGQGTGFKESQSSTVAGVSTNHRQPPTAVAVYQCSSEEESPFACVDDANSADMSTTTVDAPIHSSARHELEEASHEERPTKRLRRTDEEHVYFGPVLHNCETLDHLCEMARGG